MDSKGRLDDALDLAIGHQRPGVRLDQSMLPDALRCKLDPRQGQLDRTKICLKCLGVLGKIRLHSMSISSDARRVAHPCQETGNATRTPVNRRGFHLCGTISCLDLQKLAAIIPRLRPTGSEGYTL